MQVDSLEIQMQSDRNTNRNNQEAEQPESVLNIIRKEFFDMRGHDKEEDLKSTFYFIVFYSRIALLWSYKIICSPGVQSFQ